jgi:hypothetical protein
MPRFRLLPSAAILVLVLLCQRVNAQVAKPTHTECEFSEAHQPGGWKIPGLSKAVPTSQRLSLETSPGGVVPGVFVTELKAKSISTLVLPKCSREFAGRLSLLSMTVKVLKMSKVDFNGRVFAYVVDFEPQFQASDGPRGTLGFISVVFLDVDGSGRFTVMRYNRQPTFLFSPEIPEWARRASEKRR